MSLAESLVNKATKATLTLNRDVDDQRKWDHEQCFKFEVTSPYTTDNGGPASYYKTFDSDNPPVCTATVAGTVIDKC